MKMKNNVEILVETIEFRVTKAKLELFKHMLLEKMTTLVTKKDITEEEKTRFRVYVAVNEFFNSNNPKLFEGLDK